MDINEIRNQTPGCASVIHFNNAGASLVSSATLAAQVEYLQEEALVGSYELGARRSEEIDQVYSEIAKLINAQTDEIAFVESATVGWLRAFYSINFQEGEEIICDTTSYASNYIAFLNAKNRFNLKVTVIGQDDGGAIDLIALESAIKPTTKLISITHMPTNNGLVNPAEAVGEIAAKHRILYQLDACQSAGQYPIDVRKIKCDFLSATGRKYMRAPRGTGFLFVKKESLLGLTPLNLDLHSAEWVGRDKFVQRQDAKKYETWETNLSAKLGLAVATKQINRVGIENIWRRVTELANYLREQVSQVSHITVQDYGQVKSGIVTMTSDRFSSEELKSSLHQANINTTVAIRSGTLLDMQKRDLTSVLRVSVHYYNTKQEIDSFVRLMVQLVKA